MRVTGDTLLLAQPSAMQQFGHLLETFVVHELCQQAHWLEEPVDLGVGRGTGVVLHAGTEGWRVEEGVLAVPIARLWTPAS